MLSIGEFSKICSVTTKTLRYYDEIGLIRPVFTNHETGYRFYDISQLETMLTITKLKGYELSLDAIAEVLRDPSGEKLFAMIRKKEQELKEKKDGYDFLLQKIRKDIDQLKKGEGIMAHLNNIEVKLVQQPEMNILYSRQVTSIREAFGHHLRKLCERAAKENLTRTDAPLLTFYHDKEFDPEKCDLELAIPVKEPVTGTRDLPSQLCAMIRHEGLYDELPSAYAKIVAWIEQEGYEIVDAPYDSYLTDPADTKPEDSITEIYFPVRKK